MDDDTTAAERAKAELEEAGDRVERDADRLEGRLHEVEERLDEARSQEHPDFASGLIPGEAGPSGHEGREDE